MSKSVKGTRTDENLLKTFAGESQAQMRYDFFASAPGKERFEQIANIFEETALQGQRREGLHVCLHPVAFIQLKEENY